MLAQVKNAQTRWRIVSRCPASQKVTVAIRPTRPSLTDLRLRGDPWIVAHPNHTVGVFIDGCQLQSFAAVELDVPTLNNQLFTLRHRSPRRSQ